jgi:ribosomal protein S18 acetylase RimI-like enzyme
MMKGAKLRRATVEDFQGLEPLLQELIGDPDGNRKLAFQKALGHKDYIAYVAVLDNEIVGFADLWILPDPGHGAMLGYLTSLIVVKARRRGGIGRALVETIIETAKKRGAAEIHVTTKMDNEPAHRLYKTCGFKKRHTTLELEVAPFPEQDEGR